MSLIEVFISWQQLCTEETRSRIQVYRSKKIMKPVLKLGVRVDPQSWQDRQNDELKKQQDRRINEKVTWLNPREKELIASVDDLHLKCQYQSRANRRIFEG